ncbi:hypothetical protein P3X46_016955 [Hevea brasiliensis]|uniref:DUF868 domain-containing protein n=1 Tax=Hevea brasiliensis TaxID=3981 RepID=A0ABQ9M2Z7_HEVBR|nr:uncharacterized protein LOC110635639 [Hevea brasiliensis]KAJ9173862.1 hypothetical protein P3X46_016955 [Hevea brasiliensis]
MPNHLSGAEPFQVARSSSPSLEKETEDQQTNKVPQSCVTLIYKANVAESSRYVTVTWNKNLINYSLTIGVENPSNEDPYTCKIDLKTWQFWGRKGIKSFQVDGKRVEVYWDFRHAKFSSNPEPSSDYYVALVYDEEVVLILGDLKKDAYKRTKKRPSLIEPILLCKKENVYGKKIFFSKAMLHNEKKEHDIVIEMSSGLGDPELWISIDSFEVIHIMNLHWRFRGNEKVTMMNDVVVEIFWDVHDWLFNSSASPGAGNGLFIFKPGFPNSDTNREEDAGNGLRYDSPLERTPTSGFFHVIYAWKIE